MKRWLALAGIVVLGVAAVVVTERHKVNVPPGPAALLYLIADTEQELTRLPVSFTRMTDQEEIRAGDAIAKSYTAAQERISDADVLEVQDYITQVGWRLAAHAHRKLPYQFYYIPDNSFVNAFALPGGHVYIGAGLLALMDSEDELASVLGHEIEHIDHYHCAERIQQEQALRKIPLGQLFSLPVEVFQAGYNKDQELEADREGTRLAVEAGYSPAGAVRMMETFGRLFQEYHAHARTPQQELSQTAVSLLEGYFRSHPPASERVAQINKMIASEGWGVRPERDLAVAHIFWTAKAADALAAGKYSQAQQLALRALQLRPNQASALGVLAQAQFAQADFAGAAASYRGLQNARGWTIDVANSYALSLAAANRATAAAEFRGWLASAHGDTRELQLPLDGLLLLAGDSEPSRQRLAETRRRANRYDMSTPQELSDLGWWFYLAGDYPEAHDLINAAVQQRPDNLPMLLRLAWTQIELQRFADAFRTIGGALEPGSVRSELMMARAVARWQAQQQDTALRDFEVATSNQPQWESPRWVQALYSPLVAQSIREMKAERDRRAKAAAARR